MLVVAGHTEMGAEAVGAIPTVLQGCIHVWEGEKAEGFTVFPKDAVNLGFFQSLLEIHAAAGSSLLQILLDLKKKKRCDYTIP